MSDGTAEEALGRIFRVFDVNSDGHITERELKRLVKDMFKLVKDEVPEEVNGKRQTLASAMTLPRMKRFLSGDQKVSYRKCICRDGQG